MARLQAQLDRKDYVLLEKQKEPKLKKIKKFFKQAQNCINALGRFLIVPGTDFYHSLQRIGCNAAVKHTPRDRDVMGLNPKG